MSFTVDKKSILALIDDAPMICFSLERRWRVHRAQAAELLGEAVLDALAARLRRHLTPGVMRDPTEVIELGDPPRG